MNQNKWRVVYGCDGKKGSDKCFPIKEYMIVNPPNNPAKIRIVWMNLETARVSMS